MDSRVRKASEKSRMDGFYRRLNDTQEDPEDECLDLSADDVYAVERVVEKRKGKVSLQIFQHLVFFFFSVLLNL